MFRPRNYFRKVMMYVLASILLIASTVSCGIAPIETKTETNNIDIEAQPIITNEITLRTIDEAAKLGIEGEAVSFKDSYEGADYTIHAVSNEDKTFLTVENEGVIVSMGISEINPNAPDDSIQTLSMDFENEADLDAALEELDIEDLFLIQPVSVDGSIEPQFIPVFLLGWATKAYLRYVIIYVMAQIGWNLLGWACDWAWYKLQPHLAWRHWAFNQWWSGRLFCIVF